MGVYDDVDDASDADMRAEDEEEIGQVRAIDGMMMVTIDRRSRDDRALLRGTGERREDAWEMRTVREG